MLELPDIQWKTKQKFLIHLLDYASESQQLMWLPHRICYSHKFMQMGIVQSSKIWDLSDEIV